MRRSYELHLSSVPNGTISESCSRICHILATQLYRFSAFDQPSRHQVAAHHMRLGVLGGLAVFWVVVAVSLWAVFS